jgi:hypothetical protein
MKRVLFLVCAALVLTVGASVASAGTTIGQTGTPANLLFNGGDEIVVPAYAVPAGQLVVTSLNTQSASSCLAQGTYDLQVLRPLGGDQYMVVGDTGNQNDPCDGQLQSYPVKIPVQAGDLLGVYVVSGWDGVLTGGSFLFSFQAEPAVGDTVTISNPFSPFTVDESATLTSVPQTKNDCKKGGWQSLVDENGNFFKNQGDCVSYVATGGKNPAAGG